MSTVITAAPAVEQMKLHDATPSFSGILRGEFLKITRLRITWIMLVLLAGAIVFPYLLLITSTSVKQSFQKAPLSLFYTTTEVDLAVLRIFIGIFLMILTAYVIGQEYQFGTIRILLARGVGRLQLLCAKMLAIAIVALVLFICGLLFNSILIGLLTTILGGNLQMFNALPPAFWSNTWLYMLTVLISMGVTILLATALTVLSRSLTIGLSASLSWFAVDNIGIAFLALGYRVTHSDFWLQIGAYALGPTLNVMPQVLLPAQLKAKTVGITPFVPVDATHTLLVTLAYAAIFALVAIVLTWYVDVKE